MEAVVVTPPAPGTPEYDAAMVAKFDAAQATKEETKDDVPGTDVPPRPDHIPAKFWDTEKGEVLLDALVKSYAELEKGKGKPAVAPVVDDDEPARDPTAELDAQEVVASVGLDYAAMSSEFNELGGLSEETYKALDAKGIPSEMVDAYIAGQQALASQWDNTGYEVAGGKDAFDKMAAWAKDTMTVTERQALNDAFSGKDTTADKMKLAVAGLRAKYEAANGKAPGLLGGSPAGSDHGYQSRAQMTTDMKDPRYAKDPAFRASVERKLAATTSF